MPVTERKHFNHDKIGQCELCGKIAPCEVHHRKPLSLGGTNDIDNLIYVCFDCHKEAHKENRSDMIKAGMRNNENRKEYVIGFFELYTKLLDLIVDSNGMARVAEVLDILDEMPLRRNARKDCGFYYKQYLSAMDKFNKWIEVG